MGVFDHLPPLVARASRRTVGAREHFAEERISFLKGLGGRKRLLCGLRGVLTCATQRKRRAARYQNVICKRVKAIKFASLFCFSRRSDYWRGVLYQIISGTPLPHVSLLFACKRSRLPHPIDALLIFRLSLFPAIRSNPLRSCTILYDSSPPQVARNKMHARWHRLTPLLRHAFRRGFASLPDHKEVIMPKVSPTMTAGRLIVWKKQEGEPFAEGEEIADVESDKAAMPISAREDGFMARIYVDPDTADIPLGKILAITVEEEEDIAAFKDYVPAGAWGDAEVEAVDVVVDEKVEGGVEKGMGEYVGPVGPAIMRLLNEYPNLDLNKVTPSGPKGRMLKGDVLAAIDAGTAFTDSGATEATEATDAPDVESADVTAPEFTDVPVSSMRRSIAKRLLTSKTTVPHRYASAKYELDALLQLRKKLNSNEPSPKISVNDFVIRGVAIALRRVPEMNAFWNGDSVVLREHVDVSMAVAVAGGLITPIVKGADALGLASIAKETKRLVGRAREGVLDPDEYEGGSFSVSNLGMFGIPCFSAIINPPQSGILAVGSGGMCASSVFFFSFVCGTFEDDGF